MLEDIHKICQYKHHKPYYFKRDGYTFVVCEICDEHLIPNRLSSAEKQNDE